MFKPKGEKPLWKIVFEYVEDKSVGTVFTFDELSGLFTNLDIEKNRQPIYRARKQLARVYKNYLISEPGVGYRLVEGMNMYRHAENRMVKAKKQGEMSKFEATHINTKGMTIEQKNELRQFIAWNGMVLSSLSNNAKNIAEFQETTSSMVNDKLNQLSNSMDDYSKRLEEISKKIE